MKLSFFCKSFLISLFLIIPFQVNTNEIIKEIYFNSNELPNCGIAKAKYIFYSNLTYDLYFVCPEEPDYSPIKGTWVNQSEDQRLFHHIVTTRSFQDGYVAEDIIKFHGDFFTISWDGGRELYYKYSNKDETLEVEKRKDSNDLSGTKLSCYGDNTSYSDNTDTFIQEYVAFSFIDNLKVIYSYLLIENKIKNSDWTKYDLLFEYKVLDKEIIVNTGIEERYHFDTTIDRYDLKLYGHYNPYKSAPKCEIVDYDPLEKIKEIYQEREKKL